MNRRKIVLICAICWTAFIVIGLTIPGKSYPDSSLLDFDKAIHAGLFFILSLLWLFALAHDRLTRALTITAIVVVFSFATEWYQEMLPFGRTGDVLDAVADTAGALAGFAAWALYIVFRLEPPV